MKYSYEIFLKQLGAKLRAMRLDRGWSLRDMIADHGYHLAQWQNFEKGRGASIPSLLRMCEVFGVTLEELIRDLGTEEQAGETRAAPKASMRDQSTPKKAAVKRTRKPS